MAGGGKADLSELFAAHRGIVSEKITERKRCAALLRDLLDSNVIIDYITASTSGQTKGKHRGSQQITWSSLFHNVVGYVMKEGEAVGKMEEKSRSSSTLQSRKKDMSDMLRAYIRAANKRGHHMCVGDVVDHILAVLRNQKMVVWLCTDYSWTLLHYVLCKPYHVLQISAVAWSGLLSLYCSLFLSPASLDRTLLSRVLLSLISLFSTQCDLNTATLFAFFSQVMPKIGSEKKPKILENLLLSFSAYCSAAGRDSRGRLCHIGEAVFPTILSLCGLRHPPVVESQLIAFLRFQVRIHHPCGAHSESSGGWAENDVQWKNNLESLYERILSDFEKLSNKLQWIGKGESGFKPSLIDLTADLINQVQYIRKERADSHDQHSVVSDVRHRDKRQKIQTCWSRLRDGLSSSVDHPSLIVWLQLISWLVAKWPLSLPSEESPHLLAQLVKVLGDTKSSDALPWIFTCLNVVAVHTSTHVTSSHRHTSLTAPPHRDTWSKVWTAVLKSVSVRNAEDEGYSLLTTLVEQRLIEPDLEPWKLMNRTINNPRRPLVSFLASLIRIGHLPESLGPLSPPPTLTPSPDSHPHTARLWAHPMRIQLLNFLVPTNITVGEGEGEGRLRESVFSVSAHGASISDGPSVRPSVSLCAHTLVALTQRSCSVLQQSSYIKHHYSMQDKVSELLGYSETALECQWKDIEQIYLQSSFNTPVRVQGAVNHQPETTVYARESPMPALMSLLLELLGNRAEKLLQPIQIEVPMSVRDRIQHLVVAMEMQAYHCALTIHVLFLVGVAGGQSLGETMRRSPAIKLLPSLLKRISAALQDPLWNEVERSEFNQSAASILQTLVPILKVHENETRKLPPKCMASVELAREVLLVCFPQSLLGSCLKMALGKFPVPSRPPSQPGSTFSLLTTSTTSTSHRPSVTSSSSSPASPSPTPSLPPSSTFDDDMDICSTNNHQEPPISSETGQTCLTDPLLPGDQSVCQMEAAAFVVNWYRLVGLAPHPGGLGDHNEPNSDETFDLKKAILNILGKGEISKLGDIQIAFDFCHHLTSCDEIGEFLEGNMELISRVLTQHRKSQSVLQRSLKLLEQLAPHHEREGERQSKENGCSVTLTQLATLLSAFWSLYTEGVLCASVRLQLSSTLQAYLTAATHFPSSLTLSVKKRKKTDSAPEDVSIRNALLLMMNDADHSVRMHMAKVVTSLHRVAGSNELVPCDQQLQVFQEVLEMLRKAHLISMDQDALSQEDDSVNRVASMIATLQYQACTSPSCEAAAVAELVEGVGQGCIDEQLALQALNQISLCLGYPSTTHFLDNHLLPSLTSWLDKGLSLERYPHHLHGDTSQEKYFQDRVGTIVPLLVYRCDETALNSLTYFLRPSVSLPSLLSRMLPSSMALILPSFAQRDSHDTESLSEQRRERARESNEFLTKHLPEEEIAESMKTRMAEFVVQVLLRLFEPHTAVSHLARYSRPSDPEPCPPHFPSFAIRATLDYIASCRGVSTAASTTHTFMKQLTKRQDNIQKILLALAVAMEMTHRPFRRRQLLQSYALFVSLVSDQLGQGLGDVTSFVVMDIVHTLVRMMGYETKKVAAGGREGGSESESEREGESVKEGEGGEGEWGEGEVEEMTVSLCFHTLTTLARAALNACPEELGKHLQVVVTTLVSFAQGSNASLKKQAMQLLTLLLSHAKSPEFSLSLTQLDPLPLRDDGLFARFHQQQGILRAADDADSLEREINRFIEVDQSLPITTRTPALQRLTEIIRGRRGDVTQLLTSESNSILRLIQVLVGVASSRVTTPTVAMEMGRCLGELGGVDLNCIALPPMVHNGSFDHSSLPNSWSPVACSTAHILFLLSSLLRDSNVSVVQACSQCLPQVLAAKAAADILKKMEDIFPWTSFLYPFKSSKKSSAVAQMAQVPAANSVSVDTPDLWIPQYNHGNDEEVLAVHEAWITRLVTALLDSGGITDPVLLLVKPVCQVKASFCESLFPYLILTLLWDREDTYRPILSRYFRHFFSTAAKCPSSSSSSSFSSLSPVPTQVTQGPSTMAPCPPSVSTTIILNTVMFLRTVNRPRLKKSTLWDNNFWLDLDFLDVAMAAQQCSAYFTSLLYIEIWHGANNSLMDRADEGEDVVSMDTSTQTGLTGLENPSVHQLLLEAYSNIGEPDSLYGVCAAKSVSKETWLRLYEQEGEWEKSLSAYNLNMHLPNSGYQANLVGSLQNLGLTHVLNMYLAGVGVACPQSIPGLSRFQYEAAWRCSLWEDQQMSMLGLPGGYSGFHRHLCDSLVALRDGETHLLSSSLSSARAEVLGSLCGSGSSQEGCGRIYHSLSQLLCLSELEEAGGETGSLKAVKTPFLVSWEERLKYLNADFSYIEPVLSLRASALHCLLERERAGGASGSEMGKRNVEQLFTALCDTLLTLAKKAQDVGRYQVAEGALFSLHRLDNSRSTHSVPNSLYPSLPWKHDLQEAKLHWGRGESNLALGQLRGVIQKLKALPDPPLEVASLYPTALCLYGNWLGHTHSENPAVIVKQYLELSVTLMEKQKTGDVGALLNAYLMLARYADSQYQRVTRHMTSSAHEMKRQLLQKSQLELRRVTETVSAEARTRNRHVRTLMAQIEEDEIAMSSLEDDKQQFLEKALQNYIHCLRTGDEHDLRVFRLCALWFANASDAKINTIITEGSAQLESRKFLPLLYQLAARMSARSLATDPFQQTLQEIIFRTSVDHPHHSLYVTLALSHASMDDAFPASGHVTGVAKATRPTGRLAKKTSTAGSTVDEDKVKAAKDLIRRLHSEKPSLVHSMEQLCEAYIDLAYHDVSAHKKERKPIKFPASCILIKLAGKLAEVVVPTLDIEVDPSCRYDHLVTIDRFDTHFQLAGGVNLPKVLSCIGSDGKRRRQLVKGRDDLRQDAVMEQVFVVVNQLLQKERLTSRRKLNIRTYKVVPLSQRSGIVEWCEGTTPLGEYLVGPQGKPFQGAHSRYRPRDWASLECRKKLMDAGSKKGPSKLDTYTEITRHFCPVFHHFFMEHFPTPSEWFERRLMYTRSVATSSIVGYIVGLGDRHVQNILIDTNTAEFIHIDLGVAFEQGKTLPTPETVPFRLTRDVVDGMGVAGVEGVFRRCCEITMEVMRASQEELRTIVEVLLYDPLYMWTISPVKALNLQRREESMATGGTTGDLIFDGPPVGAGTNTVGNGLTSTNKMAERVLLRLQEKLEGIEDGVPLSVSGQVNKLIQEATDPSNLCLLFPGWQAWI